MSHQLGAALGKLLLGEPGSSPSGRDEAPEPPEPSGRRLGNATATIDVSPRGRTVAAGSPDDPTDSEAVVEAPAAGSIEKLYSDADGEIGLKIDRRKGGQLYPWSAPGNFLFRSSFPSDGVPLGFDVDEGEQLLVVWRNTSGERAVSASVTFRGGDC